jgi:pimeloyl-ACP methyl ester carboxylesterase
MTTATHSSGLAFDSGGEGGDLLVLIHGLGANARVWQPMLAQPRWPGRWIAPDLRGHGGSRHGARYATEDYAADVAALVADEAPDAAVTLLGHSLGGVIALALAGGDFGFRPAAAYALGIKIGWTDAELAQMAELSQRQPKTFAGSDEALAFYGRQSGIGPIASGSPLAERSIARCKGGWRTALDMAAYAVARPPIAMLLRTAVCPVQLARGATDPMVSAQQLLPFDIAARSIEGAGHNAMVDAPEAVWNWLGARA